MPAKTILHLDDHALFTRGVAELLSNEMEVEYFSYQSPTIALRDVMQRLQNQLPISLIITDYNHVGIRGYQFAAEIKQLQKMSSLKIPIILLTMMNADYWEIQQGIHNGTFDAYLSKGCDPYAFLDTIHNIN